MTPGYREELRRRVDQAFPDGKIERALNRYRAIVGPTPAEGSDAAKALELLANGELPDAKQIEALEKLIRMMRPVMFIRHGAADRLHADVQPTFPRWSDFQSSLQPVAYSIGAIFRVETKERKTLIGTGFVVAPGLLMTNRHVVDMLTHGSGILAPDGAVVDFEQEADLLPEKEPVPIRSVVAMHPEHDLALLQIADPEADRRALSFAGGAAVRGDDIAVVGYPVNDVVRNPMFVNALFNGRFGVKRAAPGDVVSTSERSLVHDCTTLGGNSGSPILLLATGEVAGVHREGLFLTRNEGVPGAVAREFVREHSSV